MRTIVLLAVIALGGVSLIMGDTNRRHHYGVSFDNGTCKYRKYKTTNERNRKGFLNKLNKVTLVVINRTLDNSNRKDNLTVRRGRRSVQTTMEVDIQRDTNITSTRTNFRLVPGTSPNLLT
uniref:Putative secreted salivary peptide of 9.41 kDa n=1 Tax=Ixodes ricinus TaxID=34613 RepID=V5HAN7_IXORI